MQKLNDIILSLEGQSVLKYTLLYGRYEKNGIIFNINNIYGGLYKYCYISIEIPTMRLLGDYHYTVSDRIAVLSYIQRDFSVCVHIANDTMQQSDINIQKGFFIVNKFGQRVLNNTFADIDENSVKISLSVKLPFNTSAFDGKASALKKKRLMSSMSNRQKGIISSKALKLLLINNMPQLAENFIEQFNHKDFIDAVVLYRNQQFIRSYLKQNGYITFIANGSVLPRKGKTDYKDSRSVIPFSSPESMKITIYLHDGKNISGMGIRKGITIITGDAYHGKSTILDAIREGVYNHAAGDGREYVITDESALNIEAEGGRSIRNTDISFFLSNLPVKGIEPKSFSTDNASGSTSQAAAVSEAIESGCKLMLFDEDRSANNFMYKDEKMRTVIKNASTLPFIDNAQMIFREYGISSIIIVGASGEYLKIADKVILVDRFLVSEYTDYKKTVNNENYKFQFMYRNVDFSELRKTCLSRDMEIRDDTTISLGNEILNTADILPNATRGQLDFICSFLYYLTVFEPKQVNSLPNAVNSLYRKIDLYGLGIIHQTGIRKAAQIEYVQKYDIMRILYRLKCIRFKD